MPGMWDTLMKLRIVGLFAVSFACVLPVAVAAESERVSCSVRLTVTSELPYANVPMDPTIDFSELIRQVGAGGVLDPNSIRLIDTHTDQPVPHATTEDFGYGDRGRLEWVIADPTHREYEIRFDVVHERPPLKPQAYTPRIGVGDLLRYNAGAARPVALSYPSRLVDLNGDGLRDLVGTWNYAYRPGWPWDGIVYYPRVGESEAFRFGDLVRVRWTADESSTELRHFSKIYMHADLADFDGDGLLDLVYSPSGGTSIHVYRNTGRRDPGYTPVFVVEGAVSRATSTWRPCRAVDLNSDGAIDVVVGTTYSKNTNPNGWPVRLAEAVELDAGRDPCFYDCDTDGLLDAVCLVDGAADEPRNRRVAWRRNLGGDPPRFAPPETLSDVAAFWSTSVAAVRDGPRRGLLVQHDVYQAVSFYEQVGGDGGRPSFRRFGRAESDSAVVCLSDQAWPCLSDWDDDGDLDLLAGGGYGWPRIVINEGTNERPALAEARPILSEGKPIRLLRDEVLGGEHWHNMGYSYPVYVDWDADGLSDLMLPNETNRIFWYKNVGTREEPSFGPRRQVICDGYPDDAESREKSRSLAADRSVPNNPYPYEENRPFFWRTGAAFADLNGDGLVDLLTHDGHTRKATLFVQYRDPSGELRLKKDRPPRLTDGRPIDDSVVGRKQHWTESFRCVDWDGDGRQDLVYSCAGSVGTSSIYLLRNAGTTDEPAFEPPRTLSCFGEPIKVTNHGPHPWVGDADGDGKPDV
ncbi:MAG: VCBS repeat-containing protein, partial [Planctomycetes bacterium]|nr:VCBS repeat-containing protein [Planctomycetota bacterium]